MLNKNLTFEEQVKISERLTDLNGNFISQYPKVDGEVSIGFLEELCEWICFHNNMTEKNKIETILNLESIMTKILSDDTIERPISKFAINYIPTWSKYFEEHKSKITHLIE